MFGNLFKTAVNAVNTVVQNIAKKYGGGWFSKGVQEVADSVNKTSNSTGGGYSSNAGSAPIVQGINDEDNDSLVRAKKRKKRSPAPIQPDPIPEDVGVTTEEPIVIYRSQDQKLTEAEEDQIDYLLAVEDDPLAKDMLLKIKNEGLPQDVEFADYMKQFAQWGWDDLSDEHAKAIMEIIMQDRADDGIESLVVFDEETGFVILDRIGIEGDGDHQYVGLQIEEIEMMRGRDVIFLHNHPGNLKASDEDLRVAWMAEAESVIIVTPEGFEYKYTRGENSMVYEGKSDLPFEVAPPTFEEYMELRKLSRQQAVANYYNRPEYIMGQEVSGSNDYLSKTTSDITTTTFGSTRLRLDPFVQDNEYSPTGDLTTPTNEIIAVPANTSVYIHYQIEYNGEIWYLVNPQSRVGNVGTYTFGWVRSDLVQPIAQDIPLWPSDNFPALPRLEGTGKIYYYDTLEGVTFAKDWASKDNLGFWGSDGLDNIELAAWIINYEVLEIGMQNASNPQEFYDLVVRNYYARYVNAVDIVGEDANVDPWIQFFSGLTPSRWVDINVSETFDPNTYEGIHSFLPVLGPQAKSFLRMIIAGSRQNVGYTVEDGQPSIQGMSLQYYNQTVDALRRFQAEYDNAVANGTEFEGYPLGWWEYAEIDCEIREQYEQDEDDDSIGTDGLYTYRIPGTGSKYFYLGTVAQMTASGAKLLVDDGRGNPTSLKDCPD